MSVAEVPNLGFSWPGTGSIAPGIAVESDSSNHGSAGAIVVSDANLLFTGDFKRSGVDLLISKDDRHVVVDDYFKGEKRAALASQDGAVLSGQLVDALTGEVQYAQAGAPSSAAPVIGHVSKLTGVATAIRNGVSIQLNVGDNVQKGDVVQAGANSSLGLVFIDGTVFGLSANARMVLNEMIYDPNGSNNSSLLSLVQGTITFVAGQTAKNGDMRVDTPAATMGIRGTAVLAEIDFVVPQQIGAPPVRIRVLVEPGNVVGDLLLYSKSDPTVVIGRVNSAGQVTSVLGNGDVSTQSAPPLSLAARAIIEQTLREYFPGYVPSADPNDANPRTNTPPIGSTPAIPTVPQLDPIKFPIGEPTIVPLKVDLPGETPGQLTPQVIPVTITRFNTAPEISVSNVVDASTFKIGDRVTIVDPDASNPDFNDTAVPYVAGTARISSAVGPAGTTDLASLINIDAATGAVSYSAASFAFLAPGETVTYTIAFDSRSGPDTIHENVTLTVVGVNDAPRVDAASLALGEGGTVVLGLANFGLTDPDSKSFTFTVSGVSHGRFETTADGVHWSGATTFTTADLGAGHVRFVHDGGEAAPTFSVVADDGATLDHSSNQVAATVTFTKINDAPVIDAASLTVAEGGTVVLGIENFGISDVDSTNFTFAVSGVTHGRFETTSDGVTWSIATTFTTSDLDAGHVRFVHDGSEVAPTFSVQADDGASANHASNLVSATIDFTDVNDAPVIDAASLTVAEGGTVVLGPANFCVSDPDSTGFTFTVSDVTHGYFEVYGEEGWSGTTSFTSDDLEAGHVRFVHDGSEAAPTFSVQADDGASDNHASNLVAATIDFTNVNDAPVIDAASLTVAEGGTVVLGPANFCVSDPDSTGFTFTVSDVTHGCFELYGEEGWSGTTSFTSDDLEAGHVRFVHDGSEAAPTFSVQADDGATANHVSDLVSATIDFTNVNDAPEITSASFAANKGGTVVLGLANFGVSDPDSTSFTFTVSGVTHGRFETTTDGEHWSSATSFTTAALGAGHVRFAHDGGDAAPTASLTASDGMDSSPAVSAVITLTATSYHLSSTSGLVIDVSPAGATSGFTFAGAGNVTTPGEPEDRIALGFHVGGDTVVLNSAPMSGVDEFTHIGSEIHTAGGTTFVTATLGAGHDVTLTQTISLGEDANFFATTIDIFNGGSSNISDVRFLRNFDPDQDVQPFGTFDTRNDVVQKPDATHDFAIVSAVGPYTGVTVAMVGLGADWRGSVFGFTNTDPYASRAFDSPRDPGGALEDLSISLTNDIGTIAPGQHAEVTYLTTANVATSGSNVLFGTQGNNTIDGLGGSDLIFGLGGADNFVFTAGVIRATIGDFTPGQDHIDLSAILATDALSDWIASHVAVSTTNPADTLIAISDDQTITLHHTLPSSLSVSDFIVSPTGGQV